MWEGARALKPQSLCRGPTGLAPSLSCCAQLMWHRRSYVGEGSGRLWNTGNVCNGVSAGLLVSRCPHSPSVFCLQILQEQHSYSSVCLSHTSFRVLLWRPWSPCQVQAFLAPSRPVASEVTGAAASSKT